MVLNNTLIPTGAFLMSTVKRIIPVLFFEEQTEINLSYYDTWTSVINMAPLGYKHTRSNLTSIGSTDYNVIWPVFQDIIKKVT